MGARELALRVVRDVFPDGGVARTAHAAFDYRVRRAGLSERDVAFAAELAYGAIKMRRTLDFYLAGRVKTIPPVIGEILRLAVYELVYTKADEYATVFEFVNLGKRFGHRGLANLVNAVLRGFLRDRPAAPQRESFADQEEYLATRYSLPTWLVRQWSALFGPRLEHICAAVDEPARGALVINAMREDAGEAAAALAAAGIETVASPIVAESLLIERKRPGEMHGDGRWWLQSESSAMAVDVLNPQPGEAVLDVCSGRGNKALQIAGRLLGEGTLCCIERDDRKTALLGARLEQGGASAAIVTGDATQPLLPAERCFDRVLIDAPCSGTGIVGRQPEARWKKQPADGERLAATQRALLEQIERHVYPGGALVYAVCSVDPRETTEVIDWFLARENFERGLIPVNYEGLLTENGDVLVPPGLDGRDGFYISRLERRT